MSFEQAGAIGVNWVIVDSTNRTGHPASDRTTMNEIIDKKLSEIRTWGEQLDFYQKKLESCKTNNEFFTETAISTFKELRNLIDILSQLDPDSLEEIEDPRNKGVLVALTVHMTTLKTTKILADQIYFNFKAEYNQRLQNVCDFHMEQLKIFLENFDNYISLETDLEFHKEYYALFTSWQKDLKILEDIYGQLNDPNVQASDSDACSYLYSTTQECIEHCIGLQLSVATTERYIRPRRASICIQPDHKALRNAQGG